jgi:WD40 repeat protein
MKKSKENFISSLLQSQLSLKQHSSVYYSLRNTVLYNLQPSVLIEFASDEHNNNSVSAKTTIHSLALDKTDSRFLLAGQINGTISIYDLERYSFNSLKKNIIKPLHSVSNDNALISSISWYSNDSGLFITSAYSGYIRLYDTNTFQEVSSFISSSRHSHFDKGLCLSLVCCSTAYCLFTSLFSYSLVSTWFTFFCYYEYIVYLST